MNATQQTDVEHVSSNINATIDTLPLEQIPATLRRLIHRLALAVTNDKTLAGYAKSHRFYSIADHLTCDLQDLEKLMEDAAKEAAV